MKKNKILLIFLFSTILNATSLHAFELISKSEHLQFLGKKSDKKQVTFRSITSKKTDLPNITVERPTVDVKINSPTNIHLSFKASSDSKIDIDSLQFLYGWLNLDITERIKQNAKITSSGLSANNVALPDGDHVITVKISDSKGRTKEKEIEFTIE
ncbi:MAG: hypothetical protein KAH20_09655 [Methylococcales bacterium]|nr:hypothetical protein [Methylococcales bacterium]